MKIRSGFVSNSSSSSFVAVGIKILDKSDKNLYKMFEELNFYYLDGDEDGLKKDEKAVCVILGRVENDYIESRDVSLQEMVERVKPIQKILKKNKIKHSEPKLFIGTQSC